MGKQRQHRRTRAVRRHLRFRPDVMGSGFGGAFQSGGVTGRCRLDPSPMAPERWRASPEVSASAASVALAPPRIRLMRSRIRRASSKSRACAAASISRWRSSIVLFIINQRGVGLLVPLRPSASTQSLGAPCFPLSGTRRSGQPCVTPASAKSSRSAVRPVMLRSTRLYVAPRVDR